MKKEIKMNKIGMNYGIEEMTKIITPARKKKTNTKIINNLL